ncbi:MAG: alpha-hydroxy acid oxidase, partial [Burkholderiaceae bacterium]
MSQDLLNRYPAIEDLRARARRRIPHFAWEYLDSGTGLDQSAERNMSALQEIRLMPRFMKGPLDVDLSTELFGVRYDMPFGIAPVGLTGLMWPGVEKILAKTAARYRIPYCLSTVATETPETIGPAAQGMGWFQLYPPKDPDFRRDLLQRARDSGLTTLVITADTPAQSRRERQLRAEVSVPPKQTFRTYWRAAIRPAWSIATLRHGMPRFRTLEKYVKTTDIAKIGQFMNTNMGSIDWQYIEQTRKDWAGPMLIKGILSPLDAKQAIASGADGVIVSNHGGRQFDGAPAAIDALPAVVDAISGKGAVVFDSGIRGGLDICRALALGANFVMLGRGFIYGVAALAERGGDHVAELLRADMLSNLANLGCTDLSCLPDHLNEARASAG